MIGNVECFMTVSQIQNTQTGEYHFELSKTFLFFVREIIEFMSAIFVLSIMSCQSDNLFQAFSWTAVHHLHTQPKRSGTRTFGMILHTLSLICPLANPFPLWPGPDSDHHGSGLLQPGLLHRAGRGLWLHWHPHRLLLGHHHHDHCGVRPDVSLLSSSGPGQVKCGSVGSDLNFNWKNWTWAIP